MITLYMFTAPTANNVLFYDPTQPAPVESTIHNSITFLFGCGV